MATVAEVTLREMQPQEGEGQAPASGYAATVDGMFLNKKEALAWLAAMESRAQDKAKSETDAEKVRASYALAEAAAKLQAKLRATAEEKLLASPMDLRVDLAALMPEPDEPATED